MESKKFRGSATKKPDGTWHVELDDNFKRQLDDLCPADRAEIEMIMQGLRDGTIDVNTLGTRMCSYCGEQNNNKENPMCDNCANELK